MKSSVLNKIRDFFVVNWKKKLFSVLLAALLYLYINVGDYKERTYSLPVTFQNLPEGLVIADGSQLIATLNIRARSYQFTQLDFPSIVKPVVNLENSTVGDWKYPLRVEISNVNPMPAVTLANPEIRVVIDRLETMELPIRLSFNTQSAAAFQVESVRLSSDRALVQGPGMVLHAMQFVETQPLDLSRVSNGTVLPVTLKLPRSVKNLRAAPLTARIVFVHRQTQTEIGLALVFTNLAPGLKPASDPRILLTVSPQGAMPTNISAAARVVVDCAELTAPGHYELPLSYDLPDDWKVLSAPQKVQFDLIEAQ